MKGLFRRRGATPEKPSGWKFVRWVSEPMKMNDEQSWLTLINARADAYTKLGPDTRVKITVEFEVAE